MALRTVSSKDEFHHLIKRSALTVVYMQATWAGPCRMIRPVLEEAAKWAEETFGSTLSKENAPVFLDVDIDGSPGQQLAEEFTVEAVPTTLFMSEGNVVEKVVGANQQRLKDAIAAHVTIGDAAAAP